MNAQQLEETLYHQSFRAMIRTALYEWMSYWTGTGTSTLEEPTKSNTEGVIHAIMNNPDGVVNKMAMLIINELGIKQLGCYHMLTDEIVKSLVTSALASKASYLK